MSEGSGVSFLNEAFDDARTELEAFNIRPELQYLGNLIRLIDISLDDQTAMVDSDSQKERSETSGEGTITGLGGRWGFRGERLCRWSHGQEFCLCW